MAADPPAMRSNARLVEGLFGGDWCTLTLESGRLSLVRAGTPLFDLPVSQVEAVEKLAWAPFRRGHLRIRVPGAAYTLAFPAMKGFAGRTTGGEQAARWAEAVRSRRAAP